MIGLPTSVTSRMSCDRDAGLARHFGRERIERGTDRLGHLLRAARIHHRVGDPAHQILAEADLRIHGAAGGHDLAGFEVAQVRGDGRRADIDGQCRTPAHGIPARCR